MSSEGELMENRGAQEKTHAEQLLKPHAGAGLQNNIKGSYIFCVLSVLINKL